MSYRSWMRDDDLVPIDPYGKIRVARHFDQWGNLDVVGPDGEAFWLTPEGVERWLGVLQDALDGHVGRCLDGEVK